EMLSFRDVAIDFSAEECEWLDPDQWTLYKDVIFHSFLNLNSPGNKHNTGKECGKTLPWNSPPISHQKINLRMKPYKCEECGEAFHIPSLLSKHRRIHTGEKPLKCNVCGKSYSSRSGLYSHKSIHSGEIPFKCKVCGKSYSRSSAFYSHKRIHTGEITFKCELCGKSYRYLPFECKVCDKSYSRSSAFYSHKRIHTGEITFKCELCGKSYSSRSGLYSHKSIHSGDIPFKCELCGKSYSSRSGLYSHKRIHTEEIPFKCELCGKSYSSRSGLYSHKSIHSGDLPFKCELCGKSYSSPTGLYLHKRIHRGEKPYKLFVLERNIRSVENGKIFHEPSEVLNHLIILERNGISVISLENTFMSFLVLLMTRNIKEFILERNPTSLKNVAKTLELTHNILNCRLFILDRKIMTVENGKIIHQSSGFKQHLTILRSPVNCVPRHFSTCEEILKHLIIHTGEKWHLCRKFLKLFHKLLVFLRT
ncbi:LOW QUALITY PROTEIN: hypothetical protein U0070_013853, partial [Myodes glareolus]